MDSNLEVEWTEEFGECDGSDQLFDFVVDRLVSAKKGQKEEKYKKNLSNGDIVTGGHTVAGVINWDYLALKVGIFIDSQKLSSIFHRSLNHFVHPAKKNQKRKLLPKEYFFKIDGATHQQVWRHTYGQPRGFDARCCKQKYLIIHPIICNQGSSKSNCFFFRNIS